MDDKKSFWSQAGRDGAVLGGVSIAYMLIGWGLGKLGLSSQVASGLANVFSFLLWGAKFFICIMLMKRFLSLHAAAQGWRVFKYGAAVAFLSALIYSAAYLAYLLYLEPSLISLTFEMMRESPMMDAGTLSMLDSLQPKMPGIIFFVNLGYCTLFGTILSAILSGRIERQNPFEQ